VNGVTTVVRRIAALVDSAGHQAAVVAPWYPTPPPPAIGTELRLPSLAFPPYPDIRLSLPHARRAARFLDDFGPDVVHIATEGPIGFLARSYARRRGIPLVTSFHTQFPQYARHYGAGALESLVWRWLEWFHRPARLTHTPGDAVCDELRRHGISRAVVWGRGVDTTRFHPGKRDRVWRRGLGVEDGQVVVLHVGRLAPEKNLDVLFDAWRIAHEALADRAVFVVAGDGPRGRALEQALPWVKRFGFLDPDVLATVYASCDLCVLPSETETCGLVALEAMASGLPVIAANAGGLRESVRHERNGMLVPPHDAPGFAARIIESVLDLPRARHLGAEARRTALARDLETENAELLRQYAELAGANLPRETPCAA